MNKIVKYVRPMSDLHLEFGPFEVPHLPTDSETILLLNGDIHVGGKELQDDWLKNLSQRFAYVLKIQGNHDHWCSSIDVTTRKLREGLQAQGLDNVFVLENEVFIIPGTNWKVLGGTAWTDYNKGNPVTMWTAKQNMKDFAKIRTSNYGRRLSPEFLLAEHRKFTAFVRAEASKDDGFYTIVMSHHGPHMLSGDSIYSHDYHGNGCYHSDLSDLILDHPKIKFWFHGHMHNTSNYMIGDDCNVICQPRGYHGEELNDDFDPCHLIELAA